MKVLWISNIVFPEAEILLKRETRFNSSGGWLLGLANSLSQVPEIKLTVVTVSKIVTNITKLEGKLITYYILPHKNYSQYWSQIKKEEAPNIVHIHGTECPWGKSYVDECGAKNVVVSIQGLLSACSKFFYCGLKKSDILANITLGSILFGGTFASYRRFKKESKREIELLKQVSHIVGRTCWDKAHSWAINPDAKYHFCNEVLRTEFYDGSRWQYENCTKHSVFLSQAGYPIKGLHQFLKAMPLVLRHYPDTQIRIAGRDITKRDTLRNKRLFSEYSNYICKLIKKYSLEDHICFTGPLDANEMKKEYLKTNVFICPSIIENSPNSLGEAQLLGVPCISSYVGGVPDMIPCDSYGTMYRFEEIEMLAKMICDVFSKREFLNQEEMIRGAAKRHDPIKNTQILVDIYMDICS
jgi:glycosyltransferase involved in cell wall biosynthesis